MHHRRRTGWLRLLLTVWMQMRMHACPLDTKPTTKQRLSIATSYMLERQVQGVAAKKMCPCRRA